MKYLYKYVIVMSKNYSIFYNNILVKTYFIKNK